MTETPPGTVAFDLRNRLVSIERRHPNTGVETVLIELRPGEAEAIIAARRAAQDRAEDMTA